LDFEFNFPVLNNESCVDNSRARAEPDVFDLFAHALYDERDDLLQSLWRLLEARCWELLVKGKCPARAPMLKRLFESFQVEW
jgi:hypothetical protein